MKKKSALKLMLFQLLKMYQIAGSSISAAIFSAHGTAITRPIASIAMYATTGAE